MKNFRTPLRFYSWCSTRGAHGNLAPALVLLENKGYLKVDSIGKSYTRTGKAYVAAISKEAYKEQQAFLNAISQSRDTETGVLDFLAAYVKSKNMSADFPQRIREILEHY